MRVCTIRVRQRRGFAIARRYTVPDGFVLRVLGTSSKINTVNLDPGRYPSPPVGRSAPS